jgi:mannose-6-phosphate isomerase-like protein (cupin superfamily)/DNA-binding transcriptional regulator YiaG
MAHMQKSGTGQHPQPNNSLMVKETPKLLQPYRDVKPYITKDGSIIRELMHPAVHGNHAQSLAHATVPTGKRTLLHRHLHTEELYHVVGGRGRMILGKDTFPVRTGDTVCIPPGTPHRIEATGPTPLRILCCCSPAYSHEDTELLEVEPKVIVDTLPPTKKPSRRRAPNPESLEKYRALRKKRGLNQGQFWGTILVAQSAASRYESGRGVPKPVLTLLRLAFGTQREATALLANLRRDLPSEPRPTQRAIKALATGEGAKALRQTLGLTQAAFWVRVLVSQSGGARYELGREMPEQVVMLLQLVFGTERHATTLLSALRTGSLSHVQPTADRAAPAEYPLQLA